MKPIIKNNGHSFVLHGTFDDFRGAWAFKQDLARIGYRCRLIPRKRLYGVYSRPDGDFYARRITND